MGWLSGYKYNLRRKIVQTAGTSTNGQIQVIIHAGAGTDSATDVYLASHCSNFPQDIRFTADDGTTEWSYDYETDASTTIKTFWIKVPADTSAGDVYYRIFYGKLGGLTSRSGSNTFGAANFNDFSRVTGEWARWAGVDSWAGEHGMIKDGKAYLNGAGIYVINMSDGSLDGDVIDVAGGMHGAAPIMNTAGYLFTHQFMSGNGIFKRWDLASRATPTHTYTATGVNVDFETMVYDSVQDVIMGYDSDRHIIALHSTDLTVHWDSGIAIAVGWGNAGMGVVYNGYYYVTNNNGTLYKLSMADGSDAGHLALAVGQNQSYASVIYDADHNDMIVTFGMDCTVYAVDATAMSLSWSCALPDKATGVRAGTHNGAHSHTVMSDSTQAWTTNQWVNAALININTLEAGLIASNTATTITTNSLTTGWNSGDVYQIHTNDKCVDAMYMECYHNSQFFISVRTSLTSCWMPGGTLKSKLYRISTDGATGTVTHTATEAYDGVAAISNIVCDDDYIYGSTHDYRIPSVYTKFLVYNKADLTLAKSYDLDVWKNKGDTGTSCMPPIGYNGRFILGIWGTSNTPVVHDGWWQCVYIRNAGVNTAVDCPWRGNSYHTGYLGAIQSTGNLVDEIYSDRWGLDSGTSVTESPRFTMLNSILTMTGNYGTGVDQDWIGRKSVATYSPSTRLKARAKFPTSGGYASIGFEETQYGNLVDSASIVDYANVLYARTFNEASSTLTAIEQTFTVGTGLTQDTYVDKAAPTTDSKAAAFLIVFSNANADRILIDFDVTGLVAPAGYVLESAMLELYYYWPAGALARTYQVYEQTSVWSDACWNHRTGTTDWAGGHVGGDLGTGPDETAVSVAGAGWFYLNALTAVSHCITAHSSIVRLEVKDKTETGDVYAGFYSKEEATQTTKRPILRLRWVPDRTAYHNWEIQWLAASVKFLIDGTTYATNTTNLPDGTPAINARASVGAVGTELDLDWMFTTLLPEAVQATSGAAAYKASSGLEFGANF